MAKLNKNKNLVKTKKPGSVMSLKAPVVGRPRSKSSKRAARAARAALATGAIAAQADDRRAERDRRTLYVRFRTDPDRLPADEESVRAGLHPGVRQVRVLRHGKKSDRRRIKFCFAEFADESSCKKAHAELQSASFCGGRLYVDFVGEKAKVKVKQPFKPGAKRRMPINPNRLLVTGLPPSVAGKPGKLKRLFRGCKEAVIPTRSLERSQGSYGFVQFHGPGEAKAAFDAARDMDVDGAKVTVVFAKMEKREVFGRTKQAGAKRHQEPVVGRSKRSKQETAHKAEKEDSSDEESIKDEDSKDEPLAVQQEEAESDREEQGGSENSEEAEEEDDNGDQSEEEGEGGQMMTSSRNRQSGEEKKEEVSSEEEVENDVESSENEEEEEASDAEGEEEPLDEESESEDVENDVESSEDEDGSGEKVDAEDVTDEDDDNEEG